MHNCIARDGFKHFVMVCFVAFVFGGTAFGQDSPANQPEVQSTPTPQPSPTPSLERRFLKNILRDQRVIWTAPFSVHRSDAKWMGPLAVSSAILFATDRRSAGKLEEPGDHRSRLRISSDISQGGAFYTTGGVAATFYLVGRATHNARARETGLLSMEALVDSALVTTVLKTASQRPRPPVDDASGEFFDGGRSFPSGHAASAWSVATVIASEYGQHRPFVRFAAYGLAAAISMSRFTGQNHFLSDVLIGSAIGYGVGRYVYRTNHHISLDGGNSRPGKSTTRSKLIPLVYPSYNRTDRAYGLGMQWHL